MKVRTILLALTLAGCTDNWIDPAGLHHDGEAMALNDGREIRLIVKSLDDIQREFAGTIADNPDRLAYAINFPQHCLVVVPPARYPNDPEWAAILWHELRHCAEGAYHKTATAPPRP